MTHPRLTIYPKDFAPKKLCDITLKKQAQARFTSSIRAPPSPPFQNIVSTNNCQAWQPAFWLPTAAIIAMFPYACCRPPCLSLFSLLYFMALVYIYVSFSSGSCLLNYYSQNLANGNDRRYLCIICHFCIPILCYSFGAPFSVHSSSQILPLFSCWKRKLVFKLVSGPKPFTGIRCLISSACKTVNSDCEFCSKTLSNRLIQSHGQFLEVDYRSDFV